MRLAVVARHELAALFATRRGWLSLLAFALLWAGVLIWAIVPVTRLLADAADGGAGLGALLSGSLGGSLGLRALEGWSAPELAVYWLVALYLLPSFAVLVAADQTASDLGRGTLRFHALRASRTVLFLGRFAGQLLIQLALVLVTLASVLLALALRAPERLPDALVEAPLLVSNLLVLVLPWLALMALCSALARSPRQATLFAVVAWFVVSLALALARDAFGPLPALGHVLPGSEVGALRTLRGAEALTLAPVPLAQTAVLLGVGLLAFRRRDL